MEGRKGREKHIIPCQFWCETLVSVVGFKKSLFLKWLSFFFPRMCFLLAKLTLLLLMFHQTCQLFMFLILLPQFLFQINYTHTLGFEFFSFFSRCWIKGLWIQLEDVLCNYINPNLMIISKFGHPFKVMMEMHLLIFHVFIGVCLVLSFVIIDLNYIMGHKNSSFFLISFIFIPFLNYFFIHFHVC